ncbi:CPBP family glutamic-type intramembrane protease [Halobellus sp. GM3]|uniref:CPBP family glutamic-type intramembrane protease n=1 Tax=Halobellus sp. GM3 TaxID=3458410 RepID=UPI00403DA11F
MALTPVTTVGLVIALTGFALLDRTRRALAGPAPSASGGPGPTDLREHAWKWAIPACLLVVVAAEGNSLASIGWRVAPPAVFAGQVGIGFLLLAGLNLLSAPLWARVGDGGDSLAAGIGSFASLSLPERLFVAFTAGATEETAFHGYAVERLLALTGSAPVAGGIAFLAFTVGHGGSTWDRHAVLRISQPALVMTLLYLWFRSLPVLIAIHALNDAAGLALAERFAGSVEQTPDADRDEATADGRGEPNGGHASGEDVRGSPASDDEAAALEWLRSE